MSQVGNFIKNSRNSLRITQQELGDLCGVDVTYISKIENGHSLPSKKLISKLEIALNTNELKGLCGQIVTESESQNIIVAQRDKIDFLEEENKRLKSEIWKLKKVLQEIKSLLP